MYKRKWLMLALLLSGLILFSFMEVFFNPSLDYKQDSMTAGASAGQISLCINKPPTITAISDQTATIDTLFTLSVSVSDSAGQTLSYSDNTSLFNISSAGLISFTPVSNDTGAHTILITVNDDSPCANGQSTDTFILTISAAAETPSGGAVSGGGAGGGAGTGAPVVEYLPFNPVSDGEEIGFDAVEVRAKLGQKYLFWFGELEHYLRVTEINPNNLLLEVASPSPQTVELGLKQETEIDLDDDLITDLYVKLLDIQGKIAILLVQSTREGFKTSDSLLKVAVRESQLLEKEVAITNDWGNGIDLTVTSTLRPLTVVPTESSLLKDQRDVIKLTFNPSKNAAPDVYNGIITIIGRDAFQTFTKQIAVVLEVTSTEYLFDTSLDLLKKSLLSNEELQLAITIFNPRRLTIPDVKILYLISDFENEVLWQQEELITVEEQASFTKNIPLPRGIKPGRYVLAIKVISGESLSAATEIFTVEERHLFPGALAGLAAAVGANRLFLWVIPGILILILTVFVILFVLHHKTAKTIKHIKSNRQKQPVEKIITRTRTIIQPDLSNLRTKLSLLRESYEKGYIKEDTYRKTKTKIERLIKK